LHQEESDLWTFAGLYDGHGGTAGILCVYDGHGGTAASAFCKDNLNLSLSPSVCVCIYI
ncbi:hypothetical protein KIPB_016938, partial [Kipferlia bialata]